MTYMAKIWRIIVMTGVFWTTTSSFAAVAQRSQSPAETAGSSTITSTNHETPSSTPTLVSSTSSAIISDSTDSLWTTQSISTSDAASTAITLTTTTFGSTVDTTTDSRTSVSSLQTATVSDATDSSTTGSTSNEASSTSDVTEASPASDVTTTVNTTVTSPVPGTTRSREQALEEEDKRLKIAIGVIVPVTAFLFIGGCMVYCRNKRERAGLILLDDDELNITWRRNSDGPHGD